MPQLNKGGKFVFGLSEIHSDGTICFPPQVVSEYSITNDWKIIIITGSKKTGGFCVTTPSLLSQSKLSHILSECSVSLFDKETEGVFVPYKGRRYAWLPISSYGTINPPDYTLDYLCLHRGDRLMCIRSSDISFTMGAHGPLMDKAKNYNGALKIY